ncbi:aspartyl-phosphate phosphatase Spo0E family protein [Bacillus cereus]
MSRTGKKHGFSHTKVLHLSQEIDKLINKYMIIKRNPIIVGFKGNRYIK